MLANKRFNIILSLIIAICLWAYVIGETNPTDTRTFREIPIVLQGEQTLEDNGLALLSVSAETLNVTLTGSRADINQISAKDISATVNLADAAKGENQLKIQIRVPEDVEIEDKSLNKVTVVIEERVSKEVDIEVSYEGTFDDGEEPITVDMDRSSVVVTGASSLVDKVKAVKAVVEEGKVKEDLTTTTSQLYPVDAAGETVDNVELSAKNVQVSTLLAANKTVPLVVPIEDDQKELLPKTSSAPKTITIKGKSSDLADINMVTTETVDLSDVTSDTEIQLHPILEEGVQVSDKSAENLVLKVKVTPLESRTFTFDEGDVELTGLGEDLEAEVQAAEIKIVIKGREEDLEAIEEGSITLTADLSQLEKGSHSVSLKVSCSGDYVSLDTSPDHLKITIE